MATFLTSQHPPLAQRRSTPHARLALVAIVLACAASPTAVHAQTARGNVVTVTARDFAFDMPAILPAGLTTFRLRDHGKEQHQLSIVRLDSGRTAKEGLQALLAVGHGVRPAWLHPVGGPNAIGPGGAAEATLVLQPGSYLAFCEVPGPDTLPHFAKGMVKGFTVTASPRAAARPVVLPTPDLTLTLSDFAFTFSRPLTRGRHTVAVTNSSPQPHMVVFHRFPPGQGLKDLLEWAEDPRGRVGPGEAVGGVTEIAPGQTVIMTGDFKPGHYGLICFTADRKDGRPHFAHGMQRELDVR